MNDPRNAERDLVRRMLAGDESAMETFAAGYFPGLLRFARSRLGGDPELARDLVQSTVCKALGKLSSYRGEAPLFTWLCACFRNEALMYFRQKGRRPSEVEIDDLGDGEAPRSELVAGDEAADAALLRRERARQVHGALDRLPPHYAHALEWKYVEHLSVDAISQRLGVGPKATESLLGRARRAFRDSYDRVSGRWPRAVEVRT